MTTATTETICYEVAWGIEENERGMWIDYGDGMAYSLDAEANATRTFMDLAKNGHKVGFFVDGKHVSGYDFAPEWAEWDKRCEADRETWAAEDAAAALAVVHKTRTFLYSPGLVLNWRTGRMVQPQDAVARCTCGWVEHGSNRMLARAAARAHRENPT